MSFGHRPSALALLCWRRFPNIGPDGGGFRFDLDRVEISGAGLIEQRVLWGNSVEGAAREILRTAETEADQGDRNATADAELIRQWKPWERATGPRTAEGKARVAQNGYKGGTRMTLRALARLLRKGGVAIPKY